MNMTYLAIIVVVFVVLELLVLLLANILIKDKNSGKNYSYQLRLFLTKNESKFYSALLPIAAGYNLTVCPKVRLADLIEPKKSKDWQAAFNKIKAKHIDFLLCKGVVPVLAIELDDKSHERKDRKERDKFVDDALKSAKFPILHTYNSNNLKEEIGKKLKGK